MKDTSKSIKVFFQKRNSLREKVANLWWGPHFTSPPIFFSQLSIKHL